MATIKLYINTDRGDISRAFVKSTSEPTTESNVPALVAGNKRNVEVYLIDSAGNYDARSGASNYALSIGAGPLAGTPSSGTFTLTDGTETTTALAHNASAQVVEDALNALNSSAGPFSKLVDVTSAYDGNYLVKFRTTGAVAALAGDASELSPQSAVVVDEARAGDGSTKEQQFIRLLRQPAIFQDSFTQITNGWSGELSANNSRVLELMAGLATCSIAIPLDVELTETGNEPETIARGNMLLSNEVINPASIDPANLAQLLTEALGDARYLRTTNNLSDVTNAATSRSNIGAAAAADLTAHTGSTSNPHSVTAAQVGLNNVDNTSDADKPVSTAQQAAIDLKADATALTTETNARIDADNRREFEGGVALNGVSGSFNVQSIAGATAIDQTSTIYHIWDAKDNGETFQRILNYGNWPSSGYAITIVNSTKSIEFDFRKVGGKYSVYNTAPNVFNYGEILVITAILNKNGPTFYINGSAVTLTETTAPNGTYVEGSTHLYVGNSQSPSSNRYTKGSISNLAIFNTALTATQASEIYQQGLQPWLAANPEYRRGQEVYVSDFSSGTNGWLNGSSTTLTGNIDSIGGLDNNLRAVLSAGNARHFFYKNNPIYDVPLRISGKFYIPSTNSNLDGFNIKDTATTTVFKSFDSQITDTWIDFSLEYTPQYLNVTFVPTYGGVEIFNDTGADDAIYLNNIKITKLGSLATLPLDDDCRQLKDISGNRNDATASESGVTHLKQKDLHAFRDDHADGTGGSYLIANADIIAENEVITGVTVDGRFYAASGDQDLTKRRIKLQDHGSHVDVKRSNGTTDDSAIAVTNPSDGTDFAITVLTQRI